jgi:hypothetical protein
MKAIEVSVRGGQKSANGTRIKPSPPLTKKKYGKKFIRKYSTSLAQR